LYETKDAIDFLDNPVSKQQRELQLEKFAELIVRECLKKVEEEYKPVLEDKEMMKDTHWDGYVQCGVDSYVAIREHFFGVEE
jgi:hypothetical protein